MLGLVILSSVRRVVIAILVALALATAGCGAGRQGPGAVSNAGDAILGRWSGKLHQKGIGVFEVRATIGSLEDPASNRVSYTGIDCGGNWTFLGSRDSVYRFREVIDHGKGGSCKGVGIVTLIPLGPEPADSLHYEFRGGGVVSEGLLGRRG